MPQIVNFIMEVCPHLFRILSKISRVLGRMTTQIFLHEKYVKDLVIVSPLSSFLRK